MKIIFNKIKIFNKKLNITMNKNRKKNFLKLIKYTKIILIKTMNKNKYLNNIYINYDIK